VPCPADTPDDLHKRAPSRQHQVKDKLKSGAVRQPDWTRPVRRDLAPLRPEARSRTGISATAKP
jgi:hypothetical protein